MHQESKRILWVDDEIEYLKSHILFLGQHGYEVTSATSGHDALSLLAAGHYDAVLLDQIMPDMDGLRTLSEIKKREPDLPVIFVTQNEEQQLIEDAIAYEADNLLLKPFTSSQIASSLTFLLEHAEIKEQRAIRDYIADYNWLRREIRQTPDWQKWVDIHTKLAEWDLRLDELKKADELRATHTLQKQEFNTLFAQYVEAHYKNWICGIESPILSVDVFTKYVVPFLERGKQVFFIVIDCLRLDQWLKLEPLLRADFQVTRHYYYSILPTSTLYARNALFSGLFPRQIASRYPGLWKEVDHENTSINRFEKDLLNLQLERLGLILKPKARYFKIFDTRGEEEYLQRLMSASPVSLAALVINFLDILTHKRSEMNVLKQLTPDEAAFRTLTQTWFLHSGLYKILDMLAKRDAVIILTTDHGSILCNSATKVSGDKTATSGLRFKIGNNLNAEPEAALHITKPAEYKLPDDTLGKQYLLAKEDYYFVYPNQFHEYKRQFQGGFQHGGISMEEMILPCVIMEPR